METAEVSTQSKPMSKLEMYRTRILIAAGTAGTTLVGFASASFDLNGSVGPLIDGIVALIPSLTNLVLGLIPLIIVMAVAKFFPDLFDSILSKLRM